MNDPFDPEFDLSSGEVIEKVKGGLEAALHDENLTVKKDESYGFSDTNIKIQKLVYRVIEEFELPVIRTWYKYGQFEPYGTLRPKNIEPHPLENPHGEIPTKGLGPIDHLAVKQFLCDEAGIRDEWEKPLFEFLRDNYENDAEDRFRGIYLEHLRVLEILEEIVNDNHLDENAEEYVRGVKNATTGLWYEMDSASYFEDQDIQGNRNFLDTLQMALVSLQAEKDPEGPQISAVKGAHSLYHNYICPLPAMRISVEEAKGPSDELKGRGGFKDQGSTYLEHWSESRSGYYENWEAEIVRLGLTCSPTTYQSLREGVPEAVGKVDIAALNSQSNGE